VNKRQSEQEREANAEVRRWLRAQSERDRASTRRAFEVAGDEPDRSGCPKELRARLDKPGIYNRYNADRDV